MRRSDGFRDRRSIGPQRNDDDAIDYIDPHADLYARRMCSADLPAG